MGTIPVITNIESSRKINIRGPVNILFEYGIIASTIFSYVNRVVSGKKTDRIDVSCKKDVSPNEFGFTINSGLSDGW
jgi:hypothetical protein